MSSLLAQYIDQFVIFVLVLARVSSLVMTMPAFGSSGTPMQVRAFLAVAIAALIAPLHWGVPVPRPENLIALAILLGKEGMLGLALGSAVMILLGGLQLAGQVISQMSGSSLADVFNPTFDTSVPLFSQILEMLALAIFFLLGGHRQLMQALLSSFAWMPPGTGSLPDELVPALSSVAAHSFEVAIRASAPVMMSLLLAILIVALISRTLPQLNAVAVGLNFNAMIVLAVLALSLGSAAWVFQDSVAPALNVVHDAFLKQAEPAPLAAE